MTGEEATERRIDRRRRHKSPPLLALTTALAGVLGLVALALVFRGGGYVPMSWLPLGLVAAAVGAVVSLAAPLPRLSWAQIALLLAFLLLAVWTAASVSWAISRAGAWEETDRTALFLLVAVLATLAVTLGGARAPAITAGVALGAVLVTAAAILVRLGTTSEPSRFFASGRLSYPVTYWNALGGFLMMGFWLALGLTNRGRLLDRSAGWTRPLLLAVAVILVELALLPQSRGALWSSLLVLPVFVIVSPHRFRALLDLGTVALPVVVFWGKLTGVFSAVRGGGDEAREAVGGALAAVGWSVLIVLALAVVIGVVERRIGPLSRRLRLAIGLGLAGAVLLGVGAGLGAAEVRTDGLVSYVQSQWERFTSDQAPPEGEEGRLLGLGFTSRLAQWRLALDAFRSHPVLGLGAQNYEYYHYQFRTEGSLEVRQPHSHPLQLLCELGLPGLLLGTLFVGGAMVRGLVVRFRTRERRHQATLAAVLCACTAWLVHAAVDWLWQLAGVSVVVMLLFATLIASPAQEVSTPRVAARGRWVRLAAAAFCAAVFLSTLFPWLSLEYTALAKRNAGSDPLLAIDQTLTAAWLNPAAASPLVARAGIALVAPAVAQENLALAAAAWEEAAAREPGSWVMCLGAARAFLDFRDARYGAGQDSGLSASPTQIPESGQVPRGILTSRPELSSAIASVYGLAWDELTDKAKMLLQRAQELNPLEPAIAEAGVRLYAR